MWDRSEKKKSFHGNKSVYLGDVELIPNEISFISLKEVGKSSGNLLHF